MKFNKMIASFVMTAVISGTLYAGEPSVKPQQKPTISAAEALTKVNDITKVLLLTMDTITTTISSIEMFSNIRTDPKYAEIKKALQDLQPLTLKAAFAKNPENKGKIMADTFNEVKSVVPQLVEPFLKIAYQLTQIINEMGSVFISEKAMIQGKSVRKAFRDGISTLVAIENLINFIVQTITVMPEAKPEDFEKIPVNAIKPVQDITIEAF